MSTYLTIEGFDQLSKQELFDMSVAHVGQTRTKSTTIKGCAYSGTGCAAAPFLKPENRTVADNMLMMGTSWLSLVEMEKVPRHEHLFVVRLQACHDGSPEGDSFMHMWTFSMRQLAEQHGLSTEKLDAIKL